MRWQKALLPMLLCSACTLQTNVPPDTSIDVLARDHRYNTALAALERRERDTPEYRSRRRALLDAARAWERQLLAELDVLVARQQFAAAQLQLEGAMVELPETPALRRYAARFYEQRDAFIAEQVASLTRLRGENLVREQIYYEKLRGVEGDYRVRDAVERYREDAEYFGGKLREAGLRAFEAGDWSDAATLLSLSNQLHPDEFTATHLTSAQNQLRAAQDLEQSELRQRERSRRTELRTRFDSAMRLGDIGQAEEVVTEAMQLPDSGFATGMQRQLTRVQQATAAADIETGNRLYGDGKVEQALRYWQRAQRYDNSSELQMKIDRAQRLLEHYRELREQSR